MSATSQDRKPVRTCARCKRRVGILNEAGTRSRSYTTELTNEGVSTVCSNRPSCNRAKEDLEAREKGIR